jgi:hypothetical protein
VVLGVEWMGTLTSIEDIMKQRFLWFSILLGGAVGSIQAMDDAQKIAHFRQVLSTKDCEQIRQATVAMWPNNATAAFRLQWSVATNSIVISDNGNNDVHNALHKTCGELLRDFVIREILYPAMYGQKDVGAAITQIQILNGEKYKPETLTDGSQAKCKGIFGKTAWTEDAELLNIAICKARGCDPMAFLTGMHFGETIDRNAAALHGYVGHVVNPPNTIRLLCNKNLLSLIGIAAALCVGYAIYKKYYVTDDKEDDEEEQDDNQHDETTRGQNEIA